MRAAVFQSERFGRVAFVLFTLSQLCDGLFTYNGIRLFGAGIEANPLVGWYVASFGPGPAIIGAKTFAVACGAALHITASYRTVAVLTLVYLAGAIWPWAMVFWR
jgi:hypothetical protein